VELDALPPDVLHALFATALVEFWNPAAYANAVQRETRERRSLART
jgi:hypothetical protein